MNRGDPARNLFVGPGNMLLHSEMRRCAIFRYLVGEYWLKLKNGDGYKRGKFAPLW